jgi:hypothetical protein
VKDESETWDMISPNLRGADAGHDMKAVRNMIDAGSGFPPHWRGEGGEVNVATAEAMQAPPEKFLIKRQEYFIWTLEDILYHAYLRAVEIGCEPAPSQTEYSKLFTCKSPDVTLRDNDQLASGANKMADSMAILQNTLLGKSDTLHRLATDLVFKFAGEVLSDAQLDAIVSEAKADPIEQILYPGKEAAPEEREGGSNGSE